MAQLKRRREDDTHPVPLTKKIKSDYHCPENFSPGFWDSLSEIFLTRRALRELDRRNAIKRLPETESKLVLSDRPIHRRPLTRGTLRELERRNSTRRFPEPPAKITANFARHGGPDLSDIRGFPEPEDTAAAIASQGSSKRSSRGASRRPQSERTRPTNNKTSTEDAKKTERSSAYDRNYEHHLTEHGIYPPHYDHGDGSTHYPSNFSEIQRRLKKPRASLSPTRFTEEQHRRFTVRNSTASESTVKRNIMPAIIGDHDRVCNGGIPWNNISSMTTETTVTPNPDYFEGARPGDLDPSIRKNPDLSRLIAPTTDRSKVVLSNFSGEHKGQSGSSIVAKRQVTANIAYGTRAMDAIQNHGVECPVYDEAAKAFGYTFHDGTVKIYAGHSTESNAATMKRDYHTTQLRSISMEDSVDSYIQAATGVRNAADLSRDVREQAIQRANARARQSRQLYGGVSAPEVQQHDVPTTQNTNYAEFDYIASQARPSAEDPASISLASACDQESFMTSFTSTTDPYGTPGPYESTSRSKRVQRSSTPQTTNAAKKVAPEKRRSELKFNPLATERSADKTTKAQRKGKERRR